MKIIASKAILILFILLKTTMICESQPILSLEKKHYIPCNQFQCDPFGNIYSFTQTSFSKFDSAGVLLTTYNQNKNGSIGNIDISNPLKILIYFPERSRVIYVDRNLSPIDNEIDLFSLLNESFSYCCTSYSNSIWAYSLSEINLIRINQQATITTKIDNLNQLLDKKFSIKQIIEDGNYLYIGSPDYGFVIFDRWGSLIKQIPIKYENNFNLYNDQLFYFRNDTTYSYNPLNFEETIISTNQKNIKQVFATKSNFYIQTKSDTIYRYKVE